jgi:hypothetical protein
MKRIPEIVVFVIVALLLTGAGVEIFNVAWGTGIWMGQLSPKWAGAFFLCTVSASVVIVITRVKWVSGSMLCYYEPAYTLKKVKVQLLVPRQTDTSACASQLPR